MASLSNLDIRIGPAFPVEIAPRIFVDQQIPVALRNAIVPLFEKWAHLIPPWCTKLEVFWNEEKGDAAGIECRYDYGTASLTFYPNFLSRADHQEAVVIHELLHIQLEPLANTVKDMRDFLAENHPTSKALFIELVRHAEERTVSSLTHTLMRDDR